MSEEEIIEELKVFGEQEKKYKYGQAILGLLDLYQKEKLRNDELKEINKTLSDTVIEWVNGERTSIHHIRKDKIKAKIEEVNKRENVSIADVFESMKEYAIQVLQELLEEEE